MYNIGEASRWLVMNNKASLRAGLRLIAGIWAISKALGLQSVIALVGTRDGQASVLKRTGAKLFKTVPTLVSKKFDDELQPMFFNLSQPSKVFQPLVEQLAKELDLDAFIAMRGIAHRIYSNGQHSTD